MILDLNNFDPELKAQNDLIMELGAVLGKHVQMDSEFDFKLVSHSIAWLLMHCADLMFKKQFIDKKYDYIDVISRLSKIMLKKYLITF